MMEKQKTKTPNSRTFPADELGIPLSIYVPQDYRTDSGRLNTAQYPTNKHHRFAPKSFLIHKQGSMGKALRYSCFQEVPEELHVAFNKHYDEPLLPATRDAKFGAVLLSIARYLPAEAINVSNEHPERRELTLNERQIIWANNELKPQQGGMIQKELLKYVAKRNIDGADKELVNGFLQAISDEARIEKGKQLFRIATEVAVEPVLKGYTDAWNSGLLPRQEIRTATGALYNIAEARAVPRSPGKFIMRHLAVSKSALNSSLNMLEDSLLARTAA